jgi:hypothetical protein
LSSFLVIAVVGPEAVEHIEESPPAHKEDGEENEGIIESSVEEISDSEEC